MAIVQTTEREGVYEFRLRTIDDAPGQLTITRTDDARVYVAEATIGLFGDRTELAAKLIAALESQLRAFGKKRGFDD